MTTSAVTVRHATIPNVGHCTAQKVPGALASALLPFFAATAGEPVATGCFV